MEIAISEQKEEKDTIERWTPERMQAVWLCEQEIACLHGVLSERCFQVLLKCFIWFIQLTLIHHREHLQLEVYHTSMKTDVLSFLNFI